MIYWYVDNLKLSHGDRKTIITMLQLLEHEFGKLPIARRKRHDYLAMNLNSLA